MTHWERQKYRAESRSVAAKGGGWKWAAYYPKGAILDRLKILQLEIVDGYMKAYFRHNS